jgi:hypothetical protein
MGVTIELQNLGDTRLCHDITAHLEHRSLGDKASGACVLPDREWRRAGTWECKDPMDLNGRMLSRRTPVNTSVRRSAHWF